VERSAEKRFVLTLNGGSSSLKFSVAEVANPPRRVLRDSVSSIGNDPTAHARAADRALSRLESEGMLPELVAVVHRIVHGGRLGDRSRRITPELLEELRPLASLDPDHLPAELAIIEAIAERVPATPQFACFDTTFHRTMPRVARSLALPRKYEASGLERYGFHGLSYTFLIEELARVAGPDAARGRVILAHLGSGASLAAVLDGRSVDTTMGFTPTSGVMMATRSGDLDPGVIVWMLRNEGLDADAIDDIVNRRSGLLGVSGTSADMRELLKASSSDARAADAVELFCHQVRKAVGALATTIGGVDTLVFAGGIGEKSPAIRARIGQGLEHLGVTIDEHRNAENAPLISTDESRAAVRVMVTDEEAILVREALALLEDDSPKAGETR
jgi:acetate kinase